MREPSRIFNFYLQKELFMKNNTRRIFIKGTAASSLALAGPMSALAGQVALSEVDRPVASVLASYGTPRSVEVSDQVARITIDVNGIEPFAGSFGKLTQLSDRVRVDNDNMEFTYGKTTYIIENRVA